MTLRRPRRLWTPSIWASLKPFGVGEQRPNNYAELWRAWRESAGRRGYAWRILDQGVCDGCALGTTGLRDWTLDGVHLCNIRLRLLRLNTMPAFDPAVAADVRPLAQRRPGQLRDLGRIPCPLVRRRGDVGFSPTTWDDVMPILAAHAGDTAPARMAFYLTSRGIPNETYYAVQKAARALGTNNVDNAARICHAPSTTGLKRGLGVAATTCSYKDWIGTDLVVFVGANPANNQPVTTKYLHYARKAGTRVAVVNSYREPGMARYWIPSVPESALFGTRICDDFFLVNVGGDIAFLLGAIKQVIATGRADLAFIEAHTEGFEALRERVDGLSWEELERLSGAERATMQRLGDLVGAADKAVFVWSMGITQHVFGVDGVRAIIDLALLRGFVGREGCGLMPIRGHSGVQGGAEMGAYATVYPGGRAICAENAAALRDLWGFDVPTAPGLTAPEMIDAAARDELDLLWSIGGNFLDVLPEPEHVRGALERVPVRVHQDIVLSPQMLLDPAELVVVLPATTRYEIPGGVTQTTTERRIIFSPEIEGPRVAEARPEWEVLCDLARRARPERAAALTYDGTAALRAEIARVVPFYAGVEKLRAKGDQFQYGGPHLCAGWRFPTADGKAHFGAPAPPRSTLDDGEFHLATRRGKQFNSIVHERVDALNGATREAVLMNAGDAAALGLDDGDAIELHNALGVLPGRVLIAPVLPGNLQVHWPEGNRLIARGRVAADAGIPDYNAIVRVRRRRTA